MSRSISLKFAPPWICIWPINFRTSVWLKSRSNFDIGAFFFLLNRNLQFQITFSFKFFSFFPFLSWGYKFLKAWKITQIFQKIIWKYSLFEILNFWMDWFSGMEISSSPGLKNLVLPRTVDLFSWANFWGFSRSLAFYQ